MTLNINCKITDGNIIEKNIIREFECDFSVDEDYEIDLPLMTKCSFVKDDSIRSPFEIESFTINGTEYLSKNVQ